MQNFSKTNRTKSQVFQECDILKQGQICFGGYDSSCGVHHLTPTKYCPSIAKGVPCVGNGRGCGLNHHRQVGPVPCINGQRNQRACKKGNCYYRHPGDIFPTDEQISERATRNSIAYENHLKCVSIMQGVPCGGLQSGQCELDHFPVSSKTIESRKKREERKLEQLQSSRLSSEATNDTTREDDQLYREQEETDQEQTAFINQLDPNCTDNS